MSNFEKFSIGLSFVLLAWFYTTPFLDYAKLLNLGTIFKEEEWNRYVNTYNSSSSPKYPYFLRETYPCWFTKLIGCPICLVGFVHLLIAVIGWIFFYHSLLEGSIQGIYGGFISILGYFGITFLIKD